MTTEAIVSAAEVLEEQFCTRCAFIERRRAGTCPVGQTTCGAKIDYIYRLSRPYAGIAVGAKVRVKDIFWATTKDYATVTISTDQNQRFGVACTLLADNE